MKSRVPHPLDDESEVEGESGLQPVHLVWDEIFVEMREAIARRDYTRALDLGERFLARNESHVAAGTFVDECRTIFERRIAKDLAPLDRIVVLSQPLHPLMSTEIDHRVGFMLSRIDGVMTIEELVDVSGMSRVDALRLIADCAARGLIAFE